MTGTPTGRPGEAHVRQDGVTVVQLMWGLGDVLLSTSALRAYRQLHPGERIIYRTYTENKGQGYRLEYPNGHPAEMLYGNPDIDKIIDVREPHPIPARLVKLRYAWFGGPSLDYPIQAHFYENLGLPWEKGQRFDSHYYITEDERTWARERLLDRGPFLALSPDGGWPGKLWHDRHWGELIAWAVEQGLQPIVMGGRRLGGPPWDRVGVINLTGQLNMRQSGAVLDAADYAVLIEGGLSNLRFALGKPTILLTCATQVGLQIWTPPELTTEVRMWFDAGGGAGYPAVGDPRWTDVASACEPCMWRRDHIKKHTRNVVPASIKDCPKGRSLRDVPASVVIEALEGAANG